MDAVTEALIRGVRAHLAAAVNHMDSAARNPAGSWRTFYLFEAAKSVGAAEALAVRLGTKDYDILSDDLIAVTGRFSGVMIAELARGT